MRRLHRVWYWPLLVLCLAPAVAFAQDVCPVIVQQALNAADEACQGAGRNQICYGNIQINATAREGTEGFTFQQTGDIVDVTNVQSLQLSGLDTTSNAWGVAVMRLQANLPDALPGQNVTFVLFGNVEIENAAEQLPTAALTPTAAVDVLDMPGGNVLSTAAAGGTLTANGRLEDGSWLRVRLEDGSHGWVEAAAVTADVDVTTLAVGEPGAPVFGPMQAFYFRSGIGDAPCAEAPDSGIMVQTPEGAGRVEVNVNGINVALGSTAYFRTRPENEIGISLIEGSGIAEYDGFVQYIPSGAWITVPTDDEGNVNGAPNAPQPYNNDLMFQLPVELLDREVVVPPSLTEEEIAEAVQDFIEGEVTPEPDSEAEGTDEAGETATPENAEGGGDGTEEPGGEG